jgi:hypothetical protein
VFETGVGGCVQVCVMFYTVQSFDAVDPSLKAPGFNP